MNLLRLAVTFVHQPIVTALEQQPNDYVIPTAGTARLFDTVNITFGNAA